MNMKTSLDSLKRLALRQIVDNLGTRIPSEHIHNFLNNYIKYGDVTITSLPTLVVPDTRKLSASDFTGKVTFAYLELYTHYIISSSNYETVEKLTNVSLSKYLYILFKYKEASSLIEEKKSLKEYKYVRHINFSAPKFVMASSGKNNLFDMSNTLQLAYNNMLSLPVMKSKIVYPSDITAYINDSTIASLKYTSDNKNISSTIFRKIGSHIGSVKESKCTTIDSLAATGIEFSGIIGGYISNTIYFKVISIDSSGSYIAFSYSTSVNGQDWGYQSDSLLVLENVEYDIYVLDNIKSGATFKILNADILTTDVIWSLTLDYDNLPDPNCNIKLIFNKMNPLSYIAFNDISEFDLNFNSIVQIKREETGISEDNAIYQNSVENIVPINGLAYSVDMESTQSRFKLTTDTTSKLLLKYDYDLADITGYSNTYYKAGTVLFDKLEVSNISTVVLNTEQYTSPLVGSEAISKTNILYSILTETQFGVSEIPIIPDSFYTNNPSFISNNKHFILEPIMFDDKVVRLFDNMPYNLKFKTLNESGSILYKFNNYNTYPIGNPKYSLISVAATGNKITMNNIISINTAGDINSHYVYKSNIFMGNTLSINSSSITGSDHNWTITSNKTAYMFYKDYDGLVKLALKLASSIDTQETILTQFSGNLYGKVSMLSSDESYISPYIIKYTLSCI